LYKYPCCIRRFPEVAEMVLDRCYKLKQADGDELVEMNFEFIEDTYNYQPRQQSGKTLWYTWQKADEITDFEHFSKEIRWAVLLSKYIYVL
jgi:hypothetical protein